MFDLAGVVAAIGPDEFEPIEALADAVQHQGCAISVLNGGGVNHSRSGRALSQWASGTLRSSLGGSVARRMKKIDYDGYRFPPAIIQQAIWLWLFDSP